MPRLFGSTAIALTIAVAVLTLAACSAVDPVPAGSKRISEAWTSRQPVPVLSHSFGKALTVDVAYRIQFNALHEMPKALAPVGFKAVLTGTESRQKYGATGPVAAVLPAGSQLHAAEDGYHVALRDFRQPEVEVEIGYRFSRRVQYPLPDVQALKAVVRETLPVVEFPDLSRAGTNKFTAVDLIASNAGARYFVAGPGRAPSVIDPNSVATVLYRNGEILTHGSGRDALSDQWQALLFLVNRTLASGWTIEPGQVLITGALGPSMPLQKGIYVADFGRLGRIEWMSE